MNKIIKEHYEKQLNERPTYPNYLMGFHKKFHGFYEQNKLRYGELEATKSVIEVLKSYLSNTAINYITDKNNWK